MPSTPKLTAIRGPIFSPDGGTPTGVTIEVRASKPFLVQDATDSTIHHAITSESKVISITSPTSDNTTLFSLAPTVSPVATPGDAHYVVKLKTTSGGDTKIWYERWTITDTSPFLRFGDISRVVEVEGTTFGDFILKAGDVVPGIIAFQNEVRITGGKKLYLDGGVNIHFVYDSGSGEVRLMNGATVLAAWS